MRDEAGLGGRYTIRCAVAGTWTEARHVGELRALLDELAPPAG